MKRGWLFCALASRTPKGAFADAGEPGRYSQRHSHAELPLTPVFGAVTCERRPSGKAKEEQPPGDFKLQGVLPKAGDLLLSKRSTGLTARDTPVLDHSPPDQRSSRHLVAGSSAANDLLGVSQLAMDKFLVRGALKLPPEKRKHQPKEEDGDYTEEKNGTEEKRPRLSVALPDEPCQILATPWREIRAEGLNCSYTILFSKAKADRLFQELEKEIEYFEGELTKLQVFGKWHNIPRKQVTYGDSGLTYTYSGVTFSPKPWIPVLEHIRDQIHLATSHTFNFVLINRYKDGHDHIGEHRDDEKELVSRSPIASVSFGACRDFVFRHGASRGKRTSCRIEPIKLLLEHGSLLMMNFPTNRYWYHSLPSRKKVLAPRINLTFRKVRAL